MPFLWDAAPRVVGHRGSPRDAPENTLASFRAAVAAGARAVELDVRLTKDREVVVHHDAELGRVVRGNGFVEELTLAEVRAARLPGGHQVPTLAEVLDALPRDVLLDVELKADALNSEELPAAVWRLVRLRGAQERVLATSFAPELAEEYARLADRPGGWITPFPPEREDVEQWPRLGYVALAQDAATPEALAAVRAAGRKALVWTVNDPAVARALLAQGVAGVITDRPAALLARLQADAPAR